MKQQERLRSVADHRFYTFGRGCESPRLQPSFAWPEERTTVGKPALARDRNRTTILPVHFVYIVRCRDGSLYTGYARDPVARVGVHNAGRGARYTAGRRPVTLVYTQRFRSRSAALRREYELKQWTRKQKAALVLQS